MTAKMDIIPFDKEHIKAYLDRCINFWRFKQNKEKSRIAKYYIDAFQSMRMTLYGELLEDKNENVANG